MPKVGPVPLQLRESETVVQYGHRKLVWFIRENDAWKSASTWAQARILGEDPGPGTIWARTIEVRLDVGHRLMQVDSRPAGRVQHDVLDYLRREQRQAQRQTRRTYFRVGSDGRLMRENG